MPLKAGSINDFNNSMAKAMEDAFKAEWPLVMGDAPVPESNNQMRLMFIAIAKGVVKHLHDNEGSFKVTTTIINANTTTGEVTNIDII